MEMCAYIKSTLHVSRHHYVQVLHAVIPSSTMEVLLSLAVSLHVPYAAHNAGMHTATEASPRAGGLDANRTTTTPPHYTSQVYDLIKSSAMLFTSANAEPSARSNINDRLVRW